MRKSIFLWVLVVAFLSTTLFSYNNYNVSETKRILIFPFKGSVKHPGVYEKMYYEMKKILTRAGYAIVPEYVLKFYLRKHKLDPENINIKEMLNIAEKLNADYIVRGEIEKAYATKKFRVAALIGGGIILYGNILANLTILETKSGLVVYSKRARQTSKRQLLGGLQEKKYILYETARDLVKKKLLRDFR